MLVNTFIVDKKLKFQSETFYQSTPFLKVLLYATLKLELETEELMEELQVPQ
jgi:hypothetical protein